MLVANSEGLKTCSVTGDCCAPEKSAVPVACVAPSHDQVLMKALSIHAAVLAYCINATPKKVATYEAAKLASEFDPQNRGENVDYYVAKIDELVGKFSGLAAATSAPKQETLAL